MECKVLVCEQETQFCGYYIYLRPTFIIIKVTCIVDTNQGWILLKVGV